MHGRASSSDFDTLIFQPFRRCPQLSSASGCGEFDGFTEFCKSLIFQYLIGDTAMKNANWFLLILLAFGFFKPAYSQEFTIGAGLALPPYIIQETDSGIETEILRQSLPASYKVKLSYLPFARVKVSH
jgi:hypothetical protein